jgi:hypothetical protein
MQKISDVDPNLRASLVDAMSKVEQAHYLRAYANHLGGAPDVKNS